jgi:RHS repeat-associated protein
VNSPDGGQTTFSYNDSVPYSKTSAQVIRTSPTALNKVSTTVFDGLGRVQQTQLVDSDCSSGPVKVDYTYSYDSAPPPTGTPAGRFTTVSNPYCTHADSTDGITKTRYDALDRPVRVIPPDGSDSANNVSTSYSGTTAGLTTTATDQTGASRKSQTDALGRLTAVWEDPAVANYETDYSYDVLDNLTSVTQKGGAASASWRTRSFQYDSLSRLTQAVNPESGTINYSYDADSNLFQKVAPQANQQLSATTTTTFCYDQVHRLTAKAYTALTCPLTSPPVNFLYDQTTYNGLTITNGIDRRTGMSDGSSTTAWSFDPMGRPAAERRTLNTNITKAFNFYYYLDGEMKQTVWPTGHQVTYAPNNAGRTVSALGSTFNFVSAATYVPQGALASAVIGSATGFNGITVADTYNKRLQPSTITASLPNNALVQSLTYDFHVGTADNGNVFKITNGKDASRTQNFTYDSLNRIKTAATQGISGSTCWGQKLGYMSNGVFVYGPDPWGNLTEIQSTQCASPTLSQGITTKNQFAAPMVYDAAGNLINDGSHPFTYDTENRLATAGGVTYTYDGDGKRVKKSNGTLYWTGPGSDPMLETDLAGNATAEYVFFNGKRVARVDMPSNSPKYYFEDHLGSTDIVTNPTGGIVEESDYVPYGGEVVINGSDPNRYKFSGKERDPESGLDDFEARHYSSGFGRFMQADEFAGGPTDLFDSDDPASSALPFADITDPQSLNKYAYTYNNPLRYVDPEGHQVVEELEQVVQATPPPLRPLLVAPPVLTGVLIGTALGAGINAYANHIQSQADKVMEDVKESNRAKIEEAKEKEAEPKEAEPKEEAGSGGARKGGGRDDRKINEKREQTAKSNVANLRQQRDTLRAQANKTAADKAKLRKVERQLKRETDRQRKSETHGRKDKKKQ